MRLSLTTTGLLDPRQLAAWSAERRRAIHTAVAKGMQSGGREVRDAARSEMRSAFTVKRNSFISSMGVKVFDKKPEQLPALLVGSKIPWLGLHEKGGTVRPCSTCWRSPPGASVRGSTTFSLRMPCNWPPPCSRSTRIFSWRTSYRQFKARPSDSPRRCAR